MVMAMAERCELVVLVDEADRVLGTAPKATVHSTDTPLHRGFSLFLFNAAGEVLVTRRARSKTFAGVWSNSVCGHPAPGESAVDGARRRLGDELGLRAGGIREVAPYRYRCADAAGIVENEICPILVGGGDGHARPDRREVADWAWVAWERLLADMRERPQRYSPWSREEAVILARALGLGVGAVGRGPGERWVDAAEAAG
jgi:isopentenyl-diphosphate delta-isomerase